MIVAIGSDHRGFPLKAHLVTVLLDLGHDVIDCGCDGTEPEDYPIAAFAVGERVAAREADRGVLICGSGIGVAIAANKVRGVRAAHCHDPDEARLTRQHNDCNVLCLGADRTGAAAAAGVIEAFLSSEFSGGRHGRRMNMITAYEARPYEKEVP